MLMMSRCFDLPSYLSCSRIVTETTQSKPVPLAGIPDDSMASISNQYPLEVVKPEPKSESVAASCKSEPNAAKSEPSAADIASSVPRSVETARKVDNSTLEDRYDGYSGIVSSISTRSSNNARYFNAWLTSPPNHAESPLLVYLH